MISYYNTQWNTFACIKLCWHFPCYNGHPVRLPAWETLRVQSETWGVPSSFKTDAAASWPSTAAGRFHPLLSLDIKTLKTSHKVNIWEKLQVSGGWCQSTQDLKLWNYRLDCNPKLFFQLKFIFMHTLFWFSLSSYTPRLLSWGYVTLSHFWV